MEPIATKPRMTAKDFFLYFGILISLYVSAVALISFLFSAIDIGFPKTEEYYSDPTSGIAWPLAVFIVFFPILIALLSSAIKMIHASPEKAALGVRNWFIYLTLFVTALTIAVDLIVLIYFFLSGEELTTGFILKVISIVLVAGLIFWFTWKDLRGAFITNPKLFARFRLCTSLGILALIIAGFFLIGSPSELRNEREDQLRENDLSMLQSEITTFWQSKGRLPDTLAELENPLRGFSLPTDPGTGASYEYRPVRMLTFELCATFEAESRAEGSQRGGYYYERNFEHGAGRTCFERTIDPDFFKPFEEAKPLPTMPLTN